MHKSADEKKTPTEAGVCENADEKKPAEAGLKVERRMLAACGFFNFDFVV